jgi:hypothetical protein
MREFKRGDIVNVSRTELEALAKQAPYFPNFPEKVTSTQGTITSVWRLHYSSFGDYVAVQLDMCPDVPNLEFDIDNVDLLIPVELDQRLKALEASMKVDNDKVKD